MTAKPAADSTCSAWAARVADNPPAAAQRRRPRWKKILVLAFLVLGVAVILIGWLWVYPQRADATPAATDQLQIDGNSNWVRSHIIVINYGVVQGQQDRAYVRVEVVAVGPHKPRGASVLISLIGPHVLKCTPGCAQGPHGPIAVAPIGGPYHDAASAVFVVRAGSYEVAANGAIATVSFPKVIFSGAHHVPMYLTYAGVIPVAKNYDWSSNPPWWTANNIMEWKESVLPEAAGPFAGTLTPGRVVTGVNHNAQQHDSNFTLIAGVLLGVGGGALVAFFQEALHAND
jgi:hypothetical protein